MNCYLCCGFLLKLTPRAFTQSHTFLQHCYQCLRAFSNHSSERRQLSVYYLAQGSFDMQELGIDQLIF